MNPKEKTWNYLRTKSIASNKRIDDKLYQFFNGSIPKQCWFSKDIQTAIDIALEEQAKEIIRIIKNCGVDKATGVLSQEYMIGVIIEKLEKKYGVEE